VTCHVEDNYSTYTCYGCHEHTLAKVRREHVEEGIRNFEDCVSCHRSADEDSEADGDREGEGARHRGERD